MVYRKQLITRILTNKSASTCFFNSNYSVKSKLLKEFTNASTLSADHDAKNNMSQIENQKIIQNSLSGDIENIKSVFKLTKEELIELKQSVEQHPILNQLIQPSFENYNLLEMLTFYTKLKRSILNKDEEGMKLILNSKIEKKNYIHRNEMNIIIYTYCEFLAINEGDKNKFIQLIYDLFNIIESYYQKLFLFNSNQFDMLFQTIEKVKLNEMDKFELMLNIKCKLNELGIQFNNIQQYTPFFITLLNETSIASGIKDININSRDIEIDISQLLTSTEKSHTSNEYNEQLRIKLQLVEEEMLKEEIIYDLKHLKLSLILLSFNKFNYKLMIDRFNSMNQKDIECYFILFKFALLQPEYSRKVLHVFFDQFIRNENNILGSKERSNVETMMKYLILLVDNSKDPSTFLLFNRYYQHVNQHNNIQLTQEQLKLLLKYQHYPQFKISFNLLIKDIESYNDPEYNLILLVYYTQTKNYIQANELIKEMIQNGKFQQISIVEAAAQNSIFQFYTESINNNNRISFTYDQQILISLYLINIINLNLPIYLNYVWYSIPFHLFTPCYLPISFLAYIKSKVLLLDSSVDIEIWDQLIELKQNQQNGNNNIHPLEKDEWLWQIITKN
ncbi:hypothetical protein K502DRAFT_16839 [Neoconidiobolus thromboides FSU 785]|nr:hypothetical protein K502DRAFT_16839 [Neoconidiobolus thromboides FSU 785]